MPLKIVHISDIKTRRSQGKIQVEERTYTSAHLDKTYNAETKQVNSISKHKDFVQKGEKFSIY